VTPAPPSTSWLSQLDTADRQQPTEALAAKVRLTEKLTKLKEEMGKLVLASLDRQISLTDPDRRSMERARLRRRRLQRAGRRRYRAPSDRDARDDEQRLRSAQLANKAQSEMLEAVADRSYFSSLKILACHKDGITATRPSR
jgi:hypothetical protein